MNNQWLMRTRTLLGDPAMEQLQNATVAVLGLGGVGGRRSGLPHGCGTDDFDR
ncbi:MAG: hypothetical protein U0M41_02795 [Negativibacillus sp.]|nr:hypothetical protein [Negativibacillus sp.]